MLTKQGRYQGPDHLVWEASVSLLLCAHMTLHVHSAPLKQAALSDSGQLASEEYCAYATFHACTAQSAPLEGEAPVCHSAGKF